VERRQHKYGGIKRANEERLQSLDHEQVTSSTKWKDGTGIGEKPESEYSLAHSSRIGVGPRKKKGDSIIKRLNPVPARNKKGRREKGTKKKEGQLRNKALGPWLKNNWGGIECNKNCSQTSVFTPARNERETKQGRGRKEKRRGEETLCHGARISSKWRLERRVG